MSEGQTDSLITSQMLLYWHSGLGITMSLGTFRTSCFSLALTSSLHWIIPPALQHTLCINSHHLSLKLLSYILVLLVINFHLFILRILFILCVWMFCLHICLYNKCVPYFLMPQSSLNNTISYLFSPLPVYIVGP